MSLVVAGTGHRPNKLFPEADNPYSPDLLRSLADQVASVLTVLSPAGVISGMALGFDQALALAAIDAGIPFVAALPFEGQEGLWPKPSQDSFREILAKAEKVFAVSEPGYAAWKMQARNAWMVDHSSLVLAAWNGSPGGTANCVRYARKKSVPVLLLDFPF
jgi:uncharacterized phage-like protein YoqJ